MVEKDVVSKDFRKQVLGYSGNRLSPSGSSLVAANLRLAGLRYVSEFPGAEGFSGFLGDNARWSAVRSYRRSFETDQACRAAQHRRRAPAALIRMALPCERRISRDGTAILTEASWFGARAFR
jgi:hypothetical protein